MKEDFGPYLVMPQPTVSDGNILLRAVEPDDIESIRQWRNQQMDVLRQSQVITKEAQQEYFRKYVWPEKRCTQPGQILLAIEQSRKLIGYGGLVHIAWPYRRAEVSFLLDPRLERRYIELEKIFVTYIDLICKLAFQTLLLNRLTTETYAFRKLHIRVLESHGFSHEGTLRKHVLIQNQNIDSILHGLLKDEWRVRQTYPNYNSLKVLISSASDKTALMMKMSQAAKRINAKARVIAGDISSDVLTKYMADEFWAMPPTSDLELNAIIHGCQSRHINVVLPTRDGELSFWARHSERLARIGISVVVSPYTSIERCVDKLAFAEFGAEYGLPMIPSSDSIGSLNVKSYVVKERFGAGSCSIGLDLNREQALAHAETLKNPIFQPYIKGREFSVDAWVSRSHKVKGLVLRWRDTVVGGESLVTTTFSNTSLEASCKEVIEALMLRGPVVLQALLDENGMIHVIECNPRFGGASTAGIAAGVDSLFWSLLEACGMNVEDYPFLPINGQVRQVRVPSDMYFYDSNI